MSHDNEHQKNLNKQLGIAWAAPAVMFAGSLLAANFSAAPAEQTQAKVVADAHDSFEENVSAESVSDATTLKPVLVADAPPAVEPADLVPDSASSDRANADAPIVDPPGLSHARAEPEINPTPDPIAVEGEGLALDAGGGEIVAADMAGRNDASADSDIVHLEQSDDAATVSEVISSTARDNNTEPAMAEAVTVTEVAAAGVEESVDSELAPASEVISSASESKPANAAVTFSDASTADSSLVPDVEENPSAGPEALEANVVTTETSAQVPKASTVAPPSSVSSAAGPVGKPFLGVGIRNPANSRVTTLHGNSTAVKLGVMVGDDLVSLNGMPINDIASLREVLKEVSAGDAIRLTIQRGSEKFQLGPMKISSK